MKIKKSELTEEAFERKEQEEGKDVTYLGNTLTGDSESWKRTYILWRRNNDIPKAWIGHIHTSYREDYLSYGFQLYIYNYLKRKHNLSFYVRDCEPGGCFIRYPFMWIENNFIIVMQEGGMDI